MKRATLPDFLTVEQMAEAMRLWERPNMRGCFHGDVRRIVIEPNLIEINRKLGQQNDAAFLAYAVEHVLRQWMD